MSKSIIKLYLIPAAVVLAIIVLVLIIPFGKKESPSRPNSPSQSTIPTLILPTHRALISSQPMPTIFPIPDFTGADMTQELPADVKNLGEQKTALRRLTPLTLSFAQIEFDYGNDQFKVTLTEPKDVSRAQFDSWRDQNYPSLTGDKFIFN